MQIIIYSFNRAMQLSALIDSINSNWIGGGNLSIDVIYNSSNAEFEKGYEILKNSLACKTYIVFHKETKTRRTTWSIKEFTDLYNLKLLVLCPFLRKKKTDFRDLTLEVLRKTKHACTMFLTDDSIFIRPFTLTEKVEKWIMDNPMQHQFSYRHGREFAHCSKLPHVQENTVWNFLDYDTSNHWGYNYSLDAHVYSSAFMHKLLSSVTFSNPNTLESSGVLHVRKKQVLSTGMCDERMSILSFPINIVQTTFTNDALKAMPEKLNEFYCNGYRIEYPYEDDYNTFQQYPEYVWIQKGNEAIRYSIK